MMHDGLPLAPIRTMLAAEDVRDCWDALVAALPSFGFDRAIYGYTRFREGRNLGDEDALLLLSNCPQDYLDRFVGDGLFKRSAMMRWAWTGDGAMSWSYAAERAAAGELTAEEAEVAAFNLASGMTAGMTLAFPSAWRRSNSILALIAPEGTDQAEVDARWAEDGERILALCRLAHRLMVTLPADEIGPQLTDRQREVLEWVGDGKAVADVALVMGLSVPTVEKHLRLARANLGAETTAQAVLKAQTLGRIYRVRMNETG